MIKLKLEFNRLKNHVVSLFGQPQYVIPLVIVFISALLLWRNHSWIFERYIIENYGDQQLYYLQAYNILKQINDKAQYTIGYALFYIPFLLISNVNPDWRSIMSKVIFTQAFIIVPVTYFLIFYKLTWKKSMLVLSIVAFYFAANLINSIDILTKYNALGLVPLSEPQSILTLILSYFIYNKLQHFKDSKLDKRSFFWLIFLGFSIATTIMTRSTFGILLIPIFAVFLIEKKFKWLAVIAASIVFFYIPQFIWNYWVSGNILFNGYVWYTSQSFIIEANTNYIEKLYGIRMYSMFSPIFLGQNLVTLLSSYALLIFLIVFFKLWKTKLQLFVSLVTIFNILFYLAYWWSAAGHLIDRFLLPNYILLFFIIAQNLVNSNTKIVTE